MKTFSIPLKISNSGFFELDKFQNEFLINRLKIFLFSGDLRCLNLPSKGIYTFWQNINVLGPSSKFCDRDVFNDQTRALIESQIRNEFNNWMEDDIVETVTIIGDENNKNGIVFRTKELEVAFNFEFAMIGRGLMKNSIGNFNIIEVVNVIY